jgi:nucleoside phosphorylase
MVGIGGGIPSSKADIRLGDIVVSQLVDISRGVIQYDLGKALSGGQF